MNSSNDSSPSTFATLKQSKSGQPIHAEASDYIFISTSGSATSYLGKNATSTNMTCGRGSSPHAGGGLTIVTSSGAKIMTNKWTVTQAIRGLRAIKQANRGQNDRTIPKIPMHPLTKKQTGALALKHYGGTLCKETPNTPTKMRRAQEEQPASAQACVAQIQRSPMI